MVAGYQASPQILALHHHAMKCLVEFLNVIVQCTIVFTSSSRDFKFVTDRTKSVAFAVASLDRVD